MLCQTPLIPYMTSTLQQDASIKLTFGASQTMAMSSFHQSFKNVGFDMEWENYVGFIVGSFLGIPLHGKALVFLL